MPEIELLTLSIGLGLAASLLYGELFGLAAGGMVVPGYVALYVNKPVDVGLTLLAALVTFGFLKGLSQIAIVYGRRRTALTIMIGYLVGLPSGCGSTARSRRFPKARSSASSSQG